MHPPQQDSSPTSAVLRRSRMGPSGAAFFLIFPVILSLSPAAVLSGPVSVHSIRPNFTASYYSFIDTSGAFLSSQDNTFQARIASRGSPVSTSFYFVVIHVSSNVIIWSANRNQPVSQSSLLRFSQTGLSLYDDSGQPVWSTPGNISTASSMQLLESGNLVLLDSANGSLWESFDYPTDVVVSGQNLTVGKSLVSSVSDEDLSEGNYTLVVSDNDAMLQWDGKDYWKMSMDTKAFKDTGFAVEYMTVNFTGVYLMGRSGESIVISIIFPDSSNSSDNSSLHMMKLDYNGVFNVVQISTVDGTSVQEFRSPDDTCRVPNICGSLSVCTNGGYCQCAPSFHPGAMNGSNCVPTDDSLALPGTCNGSLSNETMMVKYMSLRGDLDYSLNDFVDPTMINVNLSVCQSLCTMNCSCVGVFYSQDSRSCYVIGDSFGTLMIKSSSTPDTSSEGYVKAIVDRSRKGDSLDKKVRFPVLVAVLLPLTLVTTTIIVWLIWMRKRRQTTRLAKSSISKLGRDYSSSSGEGEEMFVSIPGLPIRIDYDELVVATDDFNTQIGSGGFGTVYKGTFADGTDVAVKKITCLGSQGKREFLTEIGVVGKIHHVNLVRLKGFCTQGQQRFLIYEFMNRGSLDHALFNGDQVLEWHERYDIALGTARGLMYLHTGCDHKIIHCDVKPENILLNNKGQVKLSDFGLSKLLSPEESGLFTTMRGTRGYLAPEWLTSAAISDKTDVYSFGMVLLEIIRGRKNSLGTDHKDPGNTNRMVYFPLLALEMHEENRYLELVDPRLAGRVRDKELEMLVRVALCCVQEEPSLRPSMSNVVGMLEGGMPVGEPVMEALNFLRFYGRRFIEAASTGEHEKNPMMLYAQTTTTSSSSHNSHSYISSHQVSGPR